MPSGPSPACALTSDPSKANISPDSATHVQCGKKLIKAQGAQWACPHCLVTGYPVAAKES